MSPIIILHGALGSASQLNPIKLFLETEGFGVYNVNFSGHGGEPFQSNFHIEQFAEDLLRYVDKFQLDRVNILGYSMGGYVALWFAHKHPERIGGIITVGTKFDWSIESAYKECSKLNPEKILEKIPAFARILEHRHAPNDWNELLRKTSDMMQGLGDSPLLTKEILQIIQHQTLICLGDQDDMADRNYSEKVAEFLPNGKFHLLKDTPHPIEKVDLKKIASLIKTAFD